MTQMPMRRILIDREPFVNTENFKPGWGWSSWGNWPVSWIDHPGRPYGIPSVALFRLKFSLHETAHLRFHVSTDNRYQIFLDGIPFGRGPERGDVQHWFFETYEGELQAGEHILAAQSWWLGEQAPYAQISVRPGFMLAVEGEWLERISTGHATWEIALMPGVSFISPGVAWGRGCNTRIDAATYPWGWETGADKLEWKNAEKVCEAVSSAWKNEIKPFWMLAPATLPAMRDEAAVSGILRHLSAGVQQYPVLPTRHLAAEAKEWESWLGGLKPLIIPAQTSRTAIVDLNNYVCAYPELAASGGKGALIRIQWAEGLYLKAEGGDKGHRDQIEGKFFQGGVGDEFVMDGGNRRVFTPLWWQAGRYLEITVVTADEPLCIEQLTIRETGYPLKMDGEFHASDDRFAGFLPIAERAMQMCSHETYMDCPYYEQLMYVGDTRLEVLTTYTMTADSRLPRKAIQLFDWSRRNSGFTQSRYPSRVCQIIPPFSLWWICMVNDYWLWRNDDLFVRDRMPGVRAVTEAFRCLLRPDGLMVAPNGWNFSDWVNTPQVWEAGIPANTDFVPSAILNLHFALTLLAKADMERSLGELQLAERDYATAMNLTQAVMRDFWDSGRGLIADDLKHEHFSEHAQCLAILGGLVEPDRLRKIGDSLRSAQDLSKATIYFSHYLFEAYRSLGEEDLLFERLNLWFQLSEQGFKTTFERVEPSRSDCHAWGAHPLFHCYATILGIRPDSPGFKRVRINPMPGRLREVSGILPHPQGSIVVHLERGEGNSLAAHVELPANLSGTLIWRGQERPLRGGATDLEFK